MPAYNIYPAVDQEYQFPPVVRQAIARYPELLNAFSAKELESIVSAHNGNGSNPHGVTKTQVGLGNVDNISDANKPVSTIQQVALDLKANRASPAFTGTPTGITKAHVGLSNVDNISDANKPVSSAQQTAIDNALGIGTARGVVAYAESTVTSGAIGSPTVILNIPTFTFKANRRYRITVEAVYTASGTTSTGAFSLNTCNIADSASAVTGLTLIRQNADRPNMANEGRAIHLCREGYKFATDTTLQVKYVMDRVTGGDGFISQGMPTNPITLVITDEGSQM